MLVLSSPDNDDLMCLEEKLVDNPNRKANCSFETLSL